MNRKVSFGSDKELAIRMFVTMFLLAALYLGFMTILFAIGADFITIAIVAALMLGIQYFFSDKLVLLSMGAKEAKPSEYPQLHAIVERLALTVGLPKPKIAVMQADMPNAFATGRSPSNSVVCVTTGIMRRLNDRELEAVLAHELSHIKNRDVAVITIASFFATIASYITQMIAWSAMFGGFGGGGRGRRENNGGAAIMLVYLVSMLVWIISFFLIRALSRYREYAADRCGAIITGAPATLATALMKISDTMQRIPQEDLRKVEQMNAFFVVPALTGASLLELLSTHPPISKRIERLMKMQQSLEGH